MREPPSLERVQGAVARSLAGLAILGVALAAWAGTARAPADLAGEIQAAYEARQPLPVVSRDPASPDLRHGYRIQSELVRLRERAGETVVGYKAGATSMPVQAKFALSEPVRGTLFESMLSGPGLVRLEGFARAFIETEIGYRFGRDITRLVHDPAQLRAAVSAVFPAVELPDIAYRDGERLTGADLAATNVAARRVLVGRDTAYPDTNAVAVRLLHDGREVAHGTGERALGDQWRALQWVVNHVIEGRGRIKEGDIVITGTLTPLMPAQPGDYRADFGAFGAVEFEVR